MRKIKSSDEAAKLLGLQSWLVSGSQKEGAPVFEYRYDRREDPTMTKEMLSHKLFDEGKKRNCIVGVIDARYEAPVLLRDKGMVIISFIMEEKDQPKELPRVNTEDLSSPMMKAEYLSKVGEMGPDWDEILTPDEAEKRLQGFKWLGPGWYLTDHESMLVIPGGMGRYKFLVYAHRNPCEGFNQAVNAPVRLDTRDSIYSVDELLRDGREHPMSEERRAFQKEKVLQTLSPILILVQRHGESSVVAITRDKGLAARWKSLDPSYSRVVGFSIDDEKLIAMIEKEEEASRGK